MDKKNLYDIATEFRGLVEADDFDPEELDRVAGDLEWKAGSIAGLLRYLGDTADSLETWADDIKAEAAILRNKQEGLKKWLLLGMSAAEVFSLEWGHWKITRQKNPDKADPYELEQIPADYFDIPPPPLPRLNRKRLLDDLKKGVPVPGARIAEPTFHLRTSLKGGRP